MDAQDWLMLVTVLVALAVPYMTFRLTVRLEHHRWLRERRQEAYTEWLLSKRSKDVKSDAQFLIPQGLQFDKSDQE
ncbi:hypothetical protein AB0B28_04910 [Glycomyces sp. NPDC046736]|uniref:hypothetical protein n=1 Tax=Glycomyces sp. NPDC046736 TaxID=3155615 RepID=UPI0033E7D7FC